MKAPDVPDPQPDRVWQFFLLTFLFSWLLWLPGILITQGLIEPNAPLNRLIGVLQWVAGVGPSLAAFFLTIKFEGKGSAYELLSRVFRLRLGVWYLPTLLLVPCSSLTSPNQTISALSLIS